MSKKRKRSRKKKDGRKAALKAFGSKIWSAVTWLPRNVRERVRLNREIYLGQESLVRTVRSNDRKIEELYLRYRMAVAHLPYSHRELSFGTAQGMGFAGNVSQGAIEAAVPARWWVRRLRHPGNAELARMRDRLRMAMETQLSLIGRFERIITRRWRETPIEFVARRLKEREEKERLRAEEQDRINRFETARDRLVQAFEQLESSQEDDPITAGTRLNFKAVETFVQEILEEADALAGKGKPAPDEEYITALGMALEDVQHGFRFWAGEIAKKRGFFDELVDLFGFIEEQHGEFSPPPEIVNISDVFRKEIAGLWGNAQWTDLKSALGDIQGMINHLADIARSFQLWGKRIAEIQTRVQETEELRSQLKDEYGEKVPPSQEWTAAWKTFQEKGLTAYALAEWGNLEYALNVIEDPLRKNEYKVRSALERLSTYVNGRSALDRSDEDVTRGAGTRHARMRAKSIGGNDDLLDPDLD